MLVCCALTFAAAIFAAALVYAQESQPADALVVKVWNLDATYDPVRGQVRGTFDIQNLSSSFGSGLGISASLITEDGAELVDRMRIPGTRSLSPNQVTKWSFSYSPAVVPSGNFLLLVEIEHKTGNKIEWSSSLVDFGTNKAYLAIHGTYIVAGTQEYTSAEGPSLSPLEDNKLVLNVTSSFDDEMEVFPKMQIREYGSDAPVSTVEYASLIVEPKSVTKNEYTVPNLDKPAVYVGELRYYDRDNNPISGIALYRWIAAGPSARILSVTQSGDTDTSGNLSFSAAVGGPADFGESLEGAKLRYEASGADGVVYASETIDLQTFFGGTSQTVSFTVQNSGGPEPGNLDLRVLDGQGRILATHSQAMIPNPSENKWYWEYFLWWLIPVTIILAIVLWRYPGGANKNKNKRVESRLMIFMLVASSLLVATYAVPFGGLLAPQRSQAIITVHGYQIDVGVGKLCLNSNCTSEADWDPIRRAYLIEDKTRTYYAAEPVTQYLCANEFSDVMLSLLFDQPTEFAGVNAPDFADNNSAPAFDSAFSPLPNSGVYVYESEDPSFATGLIKRPPYDLKDTRSNDEHGAVILLEKTKNDPYVATIPARWQEETGAGVLATSRVKRFIGSGGAYVPFVSALIVPFNFNIVSGAISTEPAVHHISASAYSNVNHSWNFHRAYLWETQALHNAIPVIFAGSSLPAPTPPTEPPSPEPPSPPPPPSSSVFDFSVSNEGNKTVGRGGNSVTNNIAVALLVGDSRNVALSATGFPAGVSHFFSPISCSPNCTSVLSMSASQFADLGTFPIVVTGSSGGILRNTNFNLSVVDLPDVSIVALPRIISPEGCTTLIWDSSNAFSCAIDNGVGDVCGSEASCDSGGTVQVCPDVTTTFTLTCRGSGGQASDNVTVAVGIIEEPKP